MAQASVLNKPIRSVSLPEIKGVIFDLDGTLVSSELDFAIIKAQVGCPRERDLLEYIESLPSPYMRQEAIDIVHHHELMDAQTANILPGVQESLVQLSHMNIPMAIVTRNFTKAAELKVQQCQIPIQHIVTRDDAPAKPDPSALLNIAKQWGLSPKHCIYVGDYLYDIQAAENANMRACLFSPDDLPSYAGRAQYVLRQFNELPQLILDHQ